MNTTSMSKKNVSIKTLSILLAVLVCTLIFYQQDTEEKENSVANLNDSQSHSHETVTGGSNSNHSGLGSVSSMLDRLKQRLEEEPGDVKGWVLLGRSYQHLQQWDEAKAAFEKAKALGYEGETLAESTSRPNHSTPSPHSHDDALAPYIEQAISKQETSGNNTSDSAALTLKVTLDPSLVDQLSPDKTVFIFARSAQPKEGGKQAAPLAVVRKQVRDLPLDIVLNDSMTMIPGSTISSVENIVVGARVSQSGSAVKQEGDIEQLSEPVPSDFKKTLALVIGN